MALVKGITQFYLPPTRLSTNVMSHPAVTPQPQSITSWYSFVIPLRVGGWVGLGGWLHIEVVCLPDDGHPSPVPIDWQYGGRGSNSRPLSRKSNALTTRLPSHQSGTRSLECCCCCVRVSSGQWWLSKPTTVHWRQSASTPRPPVWLQHLPR